MAFPEIEISGKLTAAGLKRSVGKHGERIAFRIDSTQCDLWQRLLQIADGDVKVTIGIAQPGLFEDEKANGADDGAKTPAQAAGAPIDGKARAKGRLRRLQKVKEPTGKHAIDDPDRGPVPPSATDPAI